MKPPKKSINVVTRGGVPAKPKPPKGAKKPAPTREPAPRQYCHTCQTQGVTAAEAASYHKQHQMDIDPSELAAALAAISKDVAAGRLEIGSREYFNRLAAAGRPTNS